MPIYIYIYIFSPLTHKTTSVKIMSTQVCHLLWNGWSISSYMYPTPCVSLSISVTVYNIGLDCSLIEYFRQLVS